MRIIFYTIVLLFITGCSTKSLFESEKDSGIYLDKMNKTEEAISAYKKEFVYTNDKKKKAKIAKNLALIYRYKNIDHYEMQKWYEKAFSLEDNYAILELANYYLENNDTKNAIIYLEKVDKYGYVLSKESLISIYLLIHVNYKQKNYEEAKKYIKNFEYYNNMYPIYSLYPELRNSSYKKFDIKSKDKVYLQKVYTFRNNLADFKEIDTLKKQNTSKSNYELARLNRILFRDYSEAVELYEKSHNQGSKIAALELAEFYNNDLKDISKAIFWYKKSHEIGNKDAAFQLGLFYDFDLRSYSKALKWYKKAYEKRHKASAKNISLIYKNHIKDFKKEQYWLEISKTL